MENIIETINLTKIFGKFNAVDSIFLSVKKGEIYGFLGLNGAGKTTTIRMLLGMLRPASGEAYLNGTRIHSGNQDIWNRVGYLVEIPYSYPDLTVRENLEIIRRLRLISESGVVDAVIEKLRLGQYRDIKAKNLSLGNAQRLGIAKAVMHGPDILILDEPANGLDPAGIVEIRELLVSLARDRGTTVFISSHILGEISKFAGRLGIIHQGKLIQEMDIEQLKNFQKRSLLIDARDKDKARAVLAKNGFAPATTENGLLELTSSEAVNGPENINTLLVNAGCPPTLLKMEEEDLETYFLRAISKGGDAR